MCKKDSVFHFQILRIYNQALITKYQPAWFLVAAFLVNMNLAFTEGVVINHTGYHHCWLVAPFSIICKILTFFVCDRAGFAPKYHRPSQSCTTVHGKRFIWLWNAMFWAVTYPRDGWCRLSRMHYSCWDGVDGYHQRFLHCWSVVLWFLVVSRNERETLTRRWRM